VRVSSLAHRWHLTQQLDSSVNRRGVVYDVGSPLGPLLNTRPTFDARITKRELEIIRDDLHCNAVRLSGSSTPRMLATAELALELGLEVWLSPQMWNKPRTATLQHVVASAAAAERLRRRFPDRIVLSVGSESSLLMADIVPGKTIQKRVANLFGEIKAGTHDPQRLRDYLARVTAAVRAVFGGPLTYASLTFEKVDWTLFDFVGVDHYRDNRVKDRYVSMLEPYFAVVKPMVITEVGMRGYRGAESSGALGFGIMDLNSVMLHSLPLVGRFVRMRLQKGDHVRDEALQARELAETLAILDAANVDGAFVASFDEPLSTFSDDPRFDLDMSALSLVKTYADRNGTVYPDMRWDPKEAFWSVADAYA
jgi:hypothetical protein